MCDKHLLGQHIELHMIVGCIKKNKSLRGYLEKGLISLHNISYWHGRIIWEMANRGMNHRSPLKKFNESKYRMGNVDAKKNLKELASRCLNCRNRISESL